MEEIRLSKLPNCPKCDSEYTYEDGSLFVCPECGHEWSAELETENSEDTKIIKDANGNVLNDAPAAGQPTRGEPLAHLAAHATAPRPRTRKVGTGSSR